MRRSACLLTVLLAGLVGGCSEVLHPDGPEGPGRDSLEDRVARLVNDYREALGCRRLVWKADVAAVAEAHSADMAERAYFGHRDPDGRGLDHRLRSAGINFHLAAENIALGFRYEDAAAAVVEAWVKSDGHRQIIETCSFAWHGIGFVDYRWTHIFVR